MTSINEIRVREVFAAFQIYPSHAAALEIRGKLPKRAKGKVTKEYILALANYVKAMRGEISQDAQTMLVDLGVKGGG